MTHRTNHFGMIANVGLAGLVVLSAAIAGCSSDKKTEPPVQTRVVDVVPGVAGGTIDESTKVVVKIVALDLATRKVTLADDEGNKATFVAGPEIRNLDQVHKGDKVTATLNERLVVYVQSGSDEGTSASYGAALAAAPKGAKPGGIVAESYQVVAVMTAIDGPQRVATLKFSDGSTRTLKVRPDVELTRYKVGDSVIIRVTSTLSVLVTHP